jgi:MATE family multidrug resistance protein
MFVTVLLSVFVLIVPVYLVIEVLELGLMFAWVLATVYVTLLGVTFYIRFLGGKWKAMRVIELEPQVPKIRPTKLGRVAKL